ncbi:MAG: DUF2071 domain-containing protein [Chitinophagaceae bacterium]|nr:DUF2071 domain-containing protein [Chitinophagaceae bacterium]
MFSFLKNHPFAIEAFFDSSIVLTFAIPKDELIHLIPECVELDTLNNKWAFIAIAMVQTKGLRPKGLPKILGNNFFLIGYRIFVKYTNNAGKRLRGLYIIKSETGKKKMELLGNIFTHYNYTTTDINTNHQDNKTIIKSAQSDFKLEIETRNEEVLLPLGSPFTDWKEARKFSGPLPFTFTYFPETKKILIIEGVRQNWTPKPLKVIDYHFSFLNSLHFKEAVLANAFIINNIPYYWKKGKTEQWNG